MKYIINAIKGTGGWQLQEIHSLVLKLLNRIILNFYSPFNVKVKGEINPKTLLSLLFV